MPRGRPRKKPRHISDLRGPYCTTPLVSEVLLTTSEDEYHKPCAQGVDNQSDLESDGANNGMVVFDGLKFDFRLEYEGQHENESDTDDELEWEVLHDEKFGRKLVAMSCNHDEEDPDWIPERLRKKMKKRATERKSRSTYKRGPDTMSKSERTRRSHKVAWKGQTTLDSYIFKKDQPTLNLSQSAAPLMPLADAALVAQLGSEDTTGVNSGSSAMEDSSAALDTDVTDLSAAEASFLH
ncbi:hypothetical protein K503DRAFT_477075 [Rhizopogon vinicolor AM-OR11-026]|uniref:Uncharacterized protein n=1 Tax=Rhizopogon vinicolor AM-OR11-026 TaxID=1314800 RepID=A0A1B7MN57_9AGAM|nr:hypothetical protein K503DRAFT_477075 [Rhizopogon vinicolor AM-OR11-026]